MKRKRESKGTRNKRVWGAKRCPVCEGSLRKDDGYLFCDRCRLHTPMKYTSFRERIVKK